MQIFSFFFKDFPVMIELLLNEGAHIYAFNLMKVYPLKLCCSIGDYCHLNCKLLVQFINECILLVHFLERFMPTLMKISAKGIL